MKFAAVTAITATLAASEASSEAPKQVSFIVCHANQDGEIFVMAETSGSLPEFPSHPDFKVFEQRDSLILIDPKGPIYQIGYESLMMHDGTAYPMKCEDKTEELSAGAEMLMPQIGAEKETKTMKEVRAAKKETRELEYELVMAQGKVRRLENEITTLRKELDGVHALRRRSAHLADQLPETSSLAHWLQNEDEN
ncbi:hypothetical protein [Limimaricola cinnabarinus]|uniref:Uncharacterized protein n=1 Tax=Limimaricola cinnabarinus TaxID=1125964 RepID=A0A2G1MBW8_9RHOB|nr:hypothetical protein [Limimaricola cinnabarinus]PHP26224.1 hypothetical protein CJ301_17445 [Limimaricola cinnabarinus]